MLSKFIAVKWKSISDRQIIDKKNFIYLFYERSVK